jgi:hypothetical protein
VLGYKPDADGKKPGGEDSDVARTVRHPSRAALGARRDVGILGTLDATSSQPGSLGYAWALILQRLGGYLASGGPQPFFPAAVT